MTRDREGPRPRAVIMSKRANVFYLEHARVLQKDQRVVYLTETGSEIERFFNIPERNTALLLLGKGTSITDAAARKLAESNVMVGFCGSGGSPLFGAVDLAFLAPQSEYRPTAYLQAWMVAWLNEPHRLQLARQLLRTRISITRRRWSRHTDLPPAALPAIQPACERFLHDIEQAADTTGLLQAEARLAKQMYATLAQLHHCHDFSREEGKGAQETRADRVNGFLDHGNYLAYGYAAVVLNTLGISFALPLLHGKTRRGALVFDIADLIKDAYVMPQAFQSGCKGDAQRDFRNTLIETLQDDDVLDMLFGYVQDLCEIK